MAPGDAVDPIGPYAMTQHLTLDQRVLAALADGRARPSAALAHRLGVSAAVVRRRAHSLRQQGWPLVGVAGQGYRLDPSAKPVDPVTLESAIAGYTDRVDTFAVWPIVTSTQTLVTELPQPADDRMVLAIGDRQSAGYGRQGRAWQAPAGGAITFSLRRWMPQPPSALAPLALRIGCAVADAVIALGAKGVQLKWPNDVLVHGAKTAGVLIDTSGSADGAMIVVGVGVNYDWGAERGVGDRGGDLASSAHHIPTRTRCTGCLLRAVIAALDRAATKGAGDGLWRWRELDAYQGQPVRVLAGSGPIEGTHAGVDDAGRLQLDTDAGRRRFAAGEVSLRAQPR